MNVDEPKAALDDVAGTSQ